jgi:hypothetical protein
LIVEDELPVRFEVADVAVIEAVAPSRAHHQVRSYLTCSSVAFKARRKRLRRLLRCMSQLLAQSGRSEMFAYLSAFGAKRTCRERREQSAAVPLQGEKENDTK